jgi:hypothetical protein
MHESERGKRLKSGDIDDQASFLYYSTLQFYYEFNVKLKKTLKDINEQLGVNWTLKLNMKANQLRVAEKIQAYID